MPDAPSALGMTVARFGAHYRRWHAGDARRAFGAGHDGAAVWSALSALGMTEMPDAPSALA